MHHKPQLPPMQRTWPHIDILIAQSYAYLSQLLRLHQDQGQGERRVSDRCLAMIHRGLTNAGTFSVSPTQTVVHVESEVHQTSCRQEIRGKIDSLKYELTFLLV